MPLYDYICNNCFSRREVQKPMAESDSEELCISCLKPMQRQFHAAPIVFVGKGFYSTDKTNRKKASLTVET